MVRLIRTELFPASMPYMYCIILYDAIILFNSDSAYIHILSPSCCGPCCTQVHTALLRRAIIFPNTLGNPFALLMLLCPPAFGINKCALLYMYVHSCMHTHIHVQTTYTWKSMLHMHVRTCVITHHVFLFKIVILRNFSHQKSSYLFES